MANPDVHPTPFPAASRTSSGIVNDALTVVTCTSFSDKILLTISQAGKLAHWVHVPLATTSTDPMNPGMFHNHDSSNELLPMTHLTATTVLGGTKRDDEVVGQTLATTVGSAILMKRPQEERMLVLGMGLSGAAEMGKAEFDTVVGLVLEYSGTLMPQVESAAFSTRPEPERDFRLARRQRVYMTMHSTRHALRLPEDRGDADILLSTPTAYDISLTNHAPLRFLSIVDVGQLPIQILSGQQYNVSTNDTVLQQYLKRALLACTQEHEAWWNTAQPESSLGILVAVEPNHKSEDGKPRITELLLVASKTYASDGQRLPTPPASSPFELGADTNAEPTLQVLALAISSDLLLPANLPSPPLSPALEDCETIPAIFLPQNSVSISEVVHEPPTKKRRTAESSLDAAATRRIAARHSGGGSVSAAAAPKPELSHRRTSSNANTPIQTRPLSRSPSLAASRPGSVRGTHPLESKPSTLNRVQSLSGLSVEAVQETSAEANIAIKNKDTIARVVMAGMRLYGLSQSNRKLRGTQQRSGSASPSLAVADTATADELDIERQKDEEYKAVYHQVYKGVCFSFRAHMQTLSLQGYTDALRESADKLLAMYCSDPLAQGLLGGVDDKYTPGGRKAFGSAKAEEQGKSPFDVARGMTGAGMV